MEPLKDKILASLIQLPTSYELKEGLRRRGNGTFSNDLELTEDLGRKKDQYSSQ